MLRPYSRRFAPRAPCALDRWIGSGWTLLERHAVEVGAPPAAALAALARLRVREMPAVRALFALRGLGADPDATLLEFFSARPSVLLDDLPGTELVAGVLLPARERDRGRAVRRLPRSAAEFERALALAPFAAIASFRADARGSEGALLWTERWARTRGALARTVFSAYWLAIGPFSAWIRRIFLREARARAESERRGREEGDARAPRPPETR